MLPLQCFMLGRVGTVHPQFLGKFDHPNVLASSTTSVLAHQYGNYSTNNQYSSGMHLTCTLGVMLEGAISGVPLVVAGTSPTMGVNDACIARQ
jgi:hypothetical protein